MLAKRGSGILLPIPSLPSRYGIGDLGPDAYAFVDFLVKSQQCYWQVLPFNITEARSGHSPYSSVSAFAGNPLWISPDILVRDHGLSVDGLCPPDSFCEGSVRYDKVSQWKYALLDEAYRIYCDTGLRQKEFQSFCQEHSVWLDDYALYMAIRGLMSDQAWPQWPKALRECRPNILDEYQTRCSYAIQQLKYNQYLFYRQWTLLKEYCQKQGIFLIGDLPIYVSYDSVDVWRYPRNFQLDASKNMVCVSGVPPDYFSAKGQLWNTPVYDWAYLKEQHYEWWVRRIGHHLQYFDFLRLDHFRGFSAFWEVPAGDKDARGGVWKTGPGTDFFDVLKKIYPALPLIAEDLGDIDEPVRKLMRRFHLPGMRILLFAFGKGMRQNPYFPKNHIKHCLVYTGTHDNNTVRGWFENDATQGERRQIARYTRSKITAKNVAAVFIRMAMTSCANTVILPMQDLLGLGAEARMNVPGQKRKNWRWRLCADQISSIIIQGLQALTEESGRCGSIIQSEISCTKRF